VDRFSRRRICSGALMGSGSWNFLFAVGLLVHH
jgi:hypothetical protein